MLQALSRFTLLAPRSTCTSFRTPLFPSPQPLRLFASRPHSQALSSEDLETKSRRYLRISQLVFFLRCLLKQDKNEEAVEFFKSHVSMIPPKDRAIRFSTYERGITTFLNHKLFKNAVELHQQMSAEGVYPSSGLDAKMLVCSDIVTAPHEREELESLYEKLSLILSRSSYSEPSLRELLDVMRCHPLIDIQFVRKLVDVYVKSRGPEYKMKSGTINKLILSYTHAGSIDAAEALVLPNRESADDHPRHTNAGSYTTLISELTKLRAMTPGRLSIILEGMKQSNTQVDLPLMNALVQNAVSRRNLHQAFSLYSAILRDPAPHMIPDSFTFGSLFNGLRPLLTLRSWRLLHARQPPDAPTPRQLFRQMLECHVLAAETKNSHKKHPIVRTSTLNVALRLFMHSMDYPGAFVILQTFRRLDLRPDARSYRFVITTLTAHIIVCFRPEHSQSHYGRWAVNFLGGSLRPDVLQPEAIASGLLEFGSVVEGTKFRAPEAAVILGNEKGPKDAEWDIEPLERLLARAILATMGMKSLSEGRAERAFREKLAPYFYEMVPDRLCRGRRLRRGPY